VAGERPVVAILGPTAVGKSELALALAGRAGGEIVSADAMQLYRGLPVLTGQPGDEELARVRHHLVAIWPLDHPGSLGAYAELAHAAIDGVRARGRLALVTGGSGLYARAALAELELPPAPDRQLRAQVEQRYDELGAAAAHELLARLDPAAAAAVHPNDRRRVVRALELHELGTSLQPRADRLWSPAMRHPALVFALERERAELAARIERRTVAMLAGGAVDEVRRAREAGFEPSPALARGLGLTEIAAYLDGASTLELCRERLARRTLRYARRQAIWLRKIPERIVLDASAGPLRNAERILSELP
jgi:tRNA dimethylallyltransferase